MRLATSLEIPLRTITCISNKIKQWFSNSLKIFTRETGQCLAQLGSAGLVRLLGSDPALWRRLAEVDSLQDNRFFFFNFEIGFFYFTHFGNLAPQYEGLAPSVDQLDVLFAADEKELHPRKVFDSLLHYSNLADFRGLCKAFWAANLGPDQMQLSFLDQALHVAKILPDNKDYSMLSKSIARFRLADPLQAEVVCAYVEHVVEGRLHSSSNGSYELFSLTQLFVQEASRVLTRLEGLMETVIRDSFAGLVEGMLETRGCGLFLGTGDLLDPNAIELLCARYAPDDTLTFFRDVYENCAWSSPRMLFGFDAQKWLKFCTQSQQSSFSNLLIETHRMLRSLYKQGDSSARGLAVTQLIQSRVTRTFNKFLPEAWSEPAESIHQWDPQAFERPFELFHLVSRFDLDSALLDHLDWRAARSLFSPEQVFSHAALYNAIVRARNDDFGLLKARFGLDESLYKPLWQFIVLFVREFHFGGIYITTTGQELLEGFRPSFIDQLRTKPVLLGGDPAAEFPMKMEHPTSRFLFLKHTGYDDFSKIDHFVEINGIDIITSSWRVFTGNYTETLSLDPWSRPLIIRGCDDYCAETTPIDWLLDSPRPSSSASDEFTGDFEPLLRESPVVDTVGAKRVINVFDQTLKFPVQFNFRFQSKMDSLNLQIDRYELDDDQYTRHSDVFYQADLTGFFNVTKVWNSPLLVSQSHHHKVDNRVASLFRFVTTDGEPVAPDPARDGGFYEVESVSRVNMRSRMSYLFHLEIKRDLLFVGAEAELQPLSVQNGKYFVAPLYNVEVRQRMDPDRVDSLLWRVIRLTSFFDHFELLMLSVVVATGLLTGFFLFMYSKHNPSNSRQRNAEFLL